MSYSLKVKSYSGVTNNKQQTTNTYPPILPHSSAHFLQASAHSRQCSLSCFEHSYAQRSHIFWQSTHISFENSLPRLISWAAVLHTSAHSMLISAQCFIESSRSLISIAAQ